MPQRAAGACKLHRQMTLGLCQQQLRPALALREQHDPDAEADDQIGRLDLDATGFIVGGGLEADLGGSWSLRAEGLYATFGDDHAATSLNADSDEDDFAALDDVWIARAGIVYRFSR